MSILSEQAFLPGAVDGSKLVADNHGSSQFRVQTTDGRAKCLNPHDPSTAAGNYCIGTLNLAESHQRWYPSVQFNFFADSSYQFVSAGSPPCELTLRTTGGAIATVYFGEAGGTGRYLLDEDLNRIGSIEFDYDEWHTITLDVHPDFLRVYWDYQFIDDVKVGYSNYLFETMRWRTFVFERSSLSFHDIRIGAWAY